MMAIARSEFFLISQVNFFSKGLLMNKLVSVSVLVMTVIFFPLTAKAEVICSQGGATLRKGPGTNYSKGLVVVGSGGSQVNNYFKKRGYTVPNGEQVFTSQQRQGKDDGKTWYLVGTNQWNAWVRSDFVCQGN